MRTSVHHRHPLRTAGVLAVAVLAVDVFSKQLAERRLIAPVDLVFGTELSLSHNSGVAFGALAGAPEGVVLLAVAIAVTALVAALAQGWLSASAFAVGLLAGGAVGNLIDRAADGMVTDFIDLPRWPSFNLADVAITLAVLGLVVSSGRQAGPRGPTSSPP